MNCPHCNENSRVQKFGFSRPVACCQGLKRQRYKCIRCNYRFSQNSDSFSFRQRNKDPSFNKKILDAFLYGMSNRQIAFVFGVSENCVRLRLQRLSRRAFLFHEQILRHKKIDEVIAYDGLENFAGSQYDPNNIQLAIGADSLFIYDFNFAPLNRKGRMSDWQKRKLREIEFEKGRYDPGAIRKSSVEIFKRLYDKSIAHGLQIHSDEHFQYRKALKSRELRELAVSHKTVNSKECRNYQNILFSVNHADLLVRHKIGAFRRETICFSKTEGRMLQKYMLFAVEKNFMKAQMSKFLRSKPLAHRESPAQAIGLSEKILKFGDIFDKFPRGEESKRLNEEWRAYWFGHVPEKYKRSQKFLKRIV